MTASEDSEDLAATLTRPPLEQAIDHLGDAVLDVRDLRDFAADGAWLSESVHTFPAFLACRKSFYVAVRAVAEFFVRMPRQDFTARDFLPTWEPRKALALRLDRLWWVTSKHVVHLSRARVPRDVAQWQPEDTSYRGLSAVARDCWKVLAEFSAAYSATGGEYAAHFDQMVTGAKPLTRREQAYWARVRRENLRSGGA